ncbi:MAG: hypothetical protein QF664_11630 [Dehalococcoidia bacterium]|nr:hypothetical protein [Dehalococcoidia bacterium]
MFFGVSVELTEQIDTNALLEQVRDDFELDTARDYLVRFNLRHPLCAGPVVHPTSAGVPRPIQTRIRRAGTARPARPGQAGAGTGRLRARSAAQTTAPIDGQ